MSLPLYIIAKFNPALRSELILPFSESIPFSDSNTVGEGIEKLLEAYSVESVERQPHLINITGSRPLNGIEVASKLAVVAGMDISFVHADSQSELQNSQPNVSIDDNALNLLYDFIKTSSSDYLQYISDDLPRLLKVEVLPIEEALDELVSSMLGNSASESLLAKETVRLSTDMHVLISDYSTQFSQSLARALLTTVCCKVTVLTESGSLASKAQAMGLSTTSTEQLKLIANVQCIFIVASSRRNGGTERDRLILEAFGSRNTTSRVIQICPFLSHPRFLSSDLKIQQEDFNMRLKELFADVTTVFAYTTFQFFYTLFGTTAQIAGFLKLPVPPDARLALIDLNDVVDVCVQLLVHPDAEKYCGCSLELSGPEALSIDDIVRLLSSVLKTTILFESITREEAVCNARNIGFPEELLQEYLQMLDAFQLKDHAMVTSLGSEILGRPLNTFDNYLKSTNALHCSHVLDNE